MGGSHEGGPADLVEEVVAIEPAMPEDDLGSLAEIKEPSWEFTFHPRPAGLLDFFASYQLLAFGLIFTMWTGHIVWAKIGAVISALCFVFLGVSRARSLRLRKTKLHIQPGLLSLARPKRKQQYLLEGAVLSRMNWLGSGTLTIKDGTYRRVPIPLHHPEKGPMLEEFLLAFESCGGQVRLQEWRGAAPEDTMPEVVRATRLRAFMRTKPDWFIALVILSALAGGLVWIGAPWWIIFPLALVVLVLGADQGLFETPFSDWRRSGAALSDTLEELRFEGDRVFGKAREEGKDWEAELKDCRLVQEIWQVGSETSPEWKDRLTLEVGKDRAHRLEPLAHSITLGVRRAFLARGVPIEIRRFEGSGDAASW